jgi:hypothetical protein
MEKDLILITKLKKKKKYKEFKINNILFILLINHGTI